MANWREIMHCQETTLEDLIKIYHEFANALISSKNVQFIDEVIYIDYLTFKFKSRYGIVFSGNNPKLRIKFETTTMDDDELFFDIFLNIHGTINTEYSDIMDNYSIYMLSHERIEKHLAYIMVNFLKKNNLID